MASANEIIRFALTQKGNDGGEKFWSWAGYGSRVPWCAIFVAYCASACNVPINVIPWKDSHGGPHGITEGAYYYAYCAQNNGIGTYHSGGNYQPKKGDIFVSGYTGSWAQHVGFVAEDAPVNGYFNTIEGNHSDRVATDTRSVDGGYVFITPAYDGQESGITGDTAESLVTLESLGLKDWSDVITVAKIDEYLRDECVGYGEVFLNYCIAGKINPALCLAVMQEESGCGTSSVAHQYHNYFGDMDVHNSMNHQSFDSVKAGIRYGIYCLSKGYVNKGMSFYQIAQEYCTPGAANDILGTNSRWPADVRSIYKSITGADILNADFGTGVASEDELDTNYSNIVERVGTYGSVQDSTKESKEITSSRVVSYDGAQAEAKINQLYGKSNTDTIIPEYELYIVTSDGAIAAPTIENGVTWETEESGTPGQLKFTVIKDSGISFNEGAQVVFKYKGQQVFYGYVFEKQRNEGHLIECTCYDQLRYFKNKDCYVYSGITATELLKMITKDYSLVEGEIQDTEISLPPTICDNITLFDIINNALEYTRNNGGDEFILYDNFGKITLVKPNQRTTFQAINEETVESLDYTSSINDETYNRVKLYYDNHETGVREIYINDASDTLSEWGVLQYCDSLEDGEDGRAKAKALLNQFSQKTRKLEIKNALGDISLRGGSAVYVDLNLGDLVFTGQLKCQSVKHTFSHNLHLMDLYLVGGNLT